MSETPEFKPIATAGTLKTSETSELRFYIDEYRGYSYASIRTFVQRDNYTGPTKAGITMNTASLDKMIETLSVLPAEPQVTQDTELARIPRRAGLELVVRVTIYRDSTGIDLREWVDDGTYKGWSKRGVRIPYADLKQSLGYLKELSTLLREKTKPAAAEKKPRARKAAAETPPENAG